MEIHFNDSTTAEASAETLFDVITDYANYPRFNPALIEVTVVTKNESRAEFVADRKTRIGKRLRAFDRYERTDDGDLIIERTYADNDTARSTWTIHPIDEHRCTLTIDASQSMGAIRGLLMKPALRRIFYKLNFAPFVGEAERRSKSHVIRLAA
jgi:ribosome-associated toxin RatA of RatAB toxin-antitoxin module